MNQRTAVESATIPEDVSLPILALTACAAALGGFLFGFDTAVINGAVLALRTEFGIGDWLVGLAVSLTLLGSGVGAYFAGRVADYLGRVKGMAIASILFTISAVGSGLPFGIWDFIFWRIVGGVAVGAASVIAPAYIAEISPASWRGRLGSLQQLAIVIGIFAAMLCNYFIASSAGGAMSTYWLGFKAWRWMFWAEIPPAVLYGVAVLLIPESPRYLVAKRRANEALQVLKRIVGIQAAPAKLAEIQETLQRAEDPKMRDLRDPKYGLLPVVWVGVILSILQQAVGINVIFYYSSTLWQAVGFSEQNALWVTLITSVTNVVTTLIAIATIDRFGRKPLLLMGSIGMTVTLTMIALIFWGAPLVDGQPRLEGEAGVVALIAANLYVLCFGFSWGPVVWVLLGEMFPNRIRGAALSIAVGMQWAANFLVSATFPPMSTGLGLGPTYAVYAAMAVFSYFFVRRYVNETKGLELEQMVSSPRQNRDRLATT